MRAATSDVNAFNTIRYFRTALMAAGAKGHPVPGFLPYWHPGRLGIRIGGVRGLRWSEVDLPGKQYLVRWQLEPLPPARRRRRSAP